MSENTGKDKDILKLVLVVKSVTQFDSVVQFLNRRGWRAYLASDLEEAVKVISKVKPQFVLISFNHPNKNLLNSPEIFARTFNTICIGMSESSDLKTESRLTASKITHKLMGAVSGPSIHRKITQIMSDIRVEQKNKARLDEAEEEEEAQDDLVQEGTQSNGSAGLISLSNSQDTKVDQVLQSLGEKKSENEGSIVQEGTQAKGFNLNQEGAKSNEYSITQEGADQNEHSVMQESPEDIPTSALSNGSQAEGKSKTGSYSSKKQPAYRLVDTEGEEAGKNKVSSQGAKQAKEREFGELGSGDQFFKRHQDKTDEVNSETEAINKIQKALEEVVTKVAAENDGFSGKYFKQDKVGVIPAFVNNEQGFFVIELGINQDFQLDILEDFRTILSDIAKKNGLNIVTENALLSKNDGYNLKHLTEGITKFEFRKKIDAADVYVGFIAMENDIPEPLSTDNDDMSVISMAQVFPETEFLFDAFLLFERNEKYFQYGKEGRYLSEKQIQRLAKRKHNFYIKKEDIDKFKAYYASNKILQQLKEIQGKKKAS